MSLNDHSLIPAGIRIPAVPVVPSQTSKRRTRICTQCGLVLPQDFPWTACDDCQLNITRLRADVPAPGQTLRVNQHVANLAQSQEGTKLKPTGRINPIAITAHPRSPPPLQNTFPGVRGPPYTSFFNSRGELVAPPPQVVPTDIPPIAPERVCMRYGCGVPLEPNQLFSFCDGCLRLGFGRVPPAPSPPLKRHPKRIKRDEPPSVTLISKVKRDIDTAQRGNALVQPLQGKSPELGAGNDDMNLELVYPEDEELAAQNCVDSMAMKVDNSVSRPEPTLGPGRSHLSPLTLTTTTTRSPSPQPLKRTCETLGCGGTVSPSATWQRCYKCSLQRWKERQHAAIAASSTVDSASAIGEVMDGYLPATLKAKVVHKISMNGEPEAVPSRSQAAVLNAVDNLSLSELPDGQCVSDSGEAATASGTLNIECGRDSGMELESTQVSIPGWDSDLTDLCSEDEGVTESDSDSDAKDSSMIKIRIPVLASRLPSGSNVRVCVIKRCNIALPRDYRWKICDSCRRYQRRYQRIRMEKARRRIVEFSQIEHESADPPKPPQTEIPLLEPQNNEKTPEDLRLCVVPRCRAKLPESNYRWKCCRACRTRARDDTRRSSVGNLMDLEDPVEQSSSSDISYPTFQNRSVLLLEFSAMLRRFMEAQILYLRVKLQTVGEKALSRLDAVLFAFDGEYSTVTGQRGHHSIDGQGQAGPEKSQVARMQKEAASVVEELNSALLAQFKPLESFVIQSGGVIARYKCALELIVPLRPLPKERDSKDTDTPDSSTSSSHVPYMKPMSGELEVAVVPDDSHRLLLGQRTITRFRMLG
ncbi:hypothetical protein AZE42_07389 [Rhizopogon vesiculosus]|uniref:Uncharacterized protein n=1 Tax=Rhizopogon vesiculosus TaxID=180088 RepID=A0A1J8Q5Q3_9AGAM|nr:hypothetical protein AZE42_07389 [Rhizopogon vesiculosus]